MPSPAQFSVMPPATPPAAPTPDTYQRLFPYLAGAGADDDPLAKFASPSGPAPTAHAAVQPLDSPAPAAAPGPVDTGAAPPIQPRSTGETDAAPGVAPDGGAGLDKVYQQIANMPGAPDETARINQLQDQVNNLIPKPPTTRRRIFQAIAQFAPIAIALAARNSGAAGGIAKGEVEGIKNARDVRTQRRDFVQGELDKALAEQGRTFSARGQLVRSAADLAATNAYRQGMLRIGQQNADTNATNATTRHNAADEANLRAITQAGLMYGPDGQLVPDPHSPVQQLRTAQAGLAQARAELARAQNDPNSPAYKLAKQKVDNASAEVAAIATRAQAYETYADVAAGNYNANYLGTDNKGNPLPGAPVVNGQTEGFRPFTATGATTMSKDKIQQANALEAATPPLVNAIKQNANNIGPILGRIQHLRDLVGIPTPAVAAVLAQMNSYIALNPALHGFRGMNALDAFEKSIGGVPRTPEALIAAINANTQAAVTYTMGWEKPLPSAGDATHPIQTRPQPIQPNGGARQFSAATPQPAPNAQTWSLSRWQAANPRGNPQQAKAAAAAAGYKVIP